MSDTFTEDKFPEYWKAFCDADKHLVPPDFEEKAEHLGLIHYRNVKKADLEKSFAAECGIEKGGYVWELTPIGLMRFMKRFALKETAP